MSEENRILEELYKESIDYDCWLPQPATVISKYSNVSLYKTRNFLRKLKEKGLVKFERGYIPDRFSYEGEFEEEGYFYCGWKLTEKGKGDEKYRKMYEQYCAEMDKLAKDFINFINNKEV